MKRILAIDPGTHCGYAVSPTESGVWDLTNKRFDGAGMRFVRFRSQLVEALDSAVELVVYEEVRAHAGVDAAHLYGALLGILQEVCETRKVPYTGVPVGTIKKHATTKGNAKKDIMIATAEARWPDVKIVDDNHADSLWLWDYAQKQWGK